MLFTQTYGKIIISLPTNETGALDMNGDAKASELSNTLVDSSSSTNSSTPQVGQKKESDSLFDLLGDGLPSAQPMAPGSAPSSGGGGLMDLLGDLDMGVGATPVAMPQREWNIKYLLPYPKGELNSLGLPTNTGPSLITIHMRIEEAILDK